jgi:hypothetical protein
LHGLVSEVTRYDFVHTSIDSQWYFDGETFAELQSGEIKRHVISESLNWNPLPRFFLQANFSYVLNQTDTPANNIDLVPNAGPTVVNFRNDYWTVTSGIGYIIDDKTISTPIITSIVLTITTRTQPSLSHTGKARPKTPSQQLSRVN